MQTITIKLTGTTPLLMHSDRFANPIDPLTKAHKELTSKRKKTDEDHEAIALSEWRGALYFDDEIGVYLPSENIEAAIVGAAKLQKLGTAFKRGMIMVDLRCPLEFAGKTSVDEMMANLGEYSLAKSVVVMRARIMRIRPMFRDWSTTCTLSYDEELINKSDLLKAISDAGTLIGLCDWRPRYGRFTFEEI